MDAVQNTWAACRQRDHCPKSRSDVGLPGTSVVFRSGVRQAVQFAGHEFMQLPLDAAFAKRIGLPQRNGCKRSSEDRIGR
jgi:hypothetical protein